MSGGKPPVQPRLEAHATRRALSEPNAVHPEQGINANSAQVTTPHTPSPHVRTLQRATRPARASVLWQSTHALGQDAAGGEHLRRRPVVREVAHRPLGC